jgi:hypothetical protein
MPVGVVDQRPGPTVTGTSAPFHSTTLSLVLYRILGSDDLSLQRLRHGDTPPDGPVSV